MAPPLWLRCGKGRRLATGCRTCTRLATPGTWTAARRRRRSSLDRSSSLSPGTQHTRSHARCTWPRTLRPRRPPILAQGSSPPAARPQAVHSSLADHPRSWARRRRRPFRRWTWSWLPPRLSKLAERESRPWSRAAAWLWCTPHTETGMIGVWRHPRMCRKGVARSMRRRRRPCLRHRGLSGRGSWRQRRRGAGRTPYAGARVPSRCCGPAF